MSLSIIIPLYNEAASVPYLKERLREPMAQLGRGQSVELVLVDDGSEDGTYRLLVEHFSGGSAQILRHERNRGVGAALRTGLRAARGNYLCTMDSDCTYDPMQFVPMLAALQAANADIITGSPYHPQGRVENVKFWRLLLSLGLSRLYSLILPYALHTYTSFFRIYRRRVIEAIDFQSDGFLSVTELLVLAVMRGYKVVEFPTTLYSRQYGCSKIKILRVMWSHLGFIARALGHRLPQPAGAPAPARPFLVSAGSRSASLLAGSPAADALTNREATESRHGDDQESTPAPPMVA